jgi:hypothetical protein
MLKTQNTLVSLKLLQNVWYPKAVCIKIQNKRRTNQTRTAYVETASTIDTCSGSRNNTIYAQRLLVNKLIYKLSQSPKKSKNYVCSSSDMLGRLQLDTVKCSYSFALYSFSPSLSLSGLLTPGFIQHSCFHVHVPVKQPATRRFITSKTISN